tara:strand:- start:20020 stop:21015 length:996 start_codon:yes stop_codon:yes gene_type:complete
MTNNPFLSTTFKKIWLKHFNNGKPSHGFKFISDLTFIKQKYFPLYINTGKNHTNGISYRLTQPDLNTDFKKKVFLIYDVPTYFKTDINTHNPKLKLNCIDQYNGVLTDVNEYESYDDFYMSKFKSKTRYNLNKKKKQLESGFNISYSFYDENTTEDEYGFLSLHLKELITKRFNSRKENNQVVSEWNYYQELMYPMLKEKRAVIITVNHDNIPIGMTFNFLSENVLFYAITTFDTDFLDYNIGHTTIMEVFKWSFDNGINIIDFSKGQTEYKSRWENKEYQFQNHILYDASSIRATLLGKTISNYFKFKQYLRDKNFNLLFSKLKFLLKSS